MNIVSVKVDEIKIGERFRKDFGDVENLAVSIRRLGLLFPIIIDRQKNLIAGERRLLAHKMLNLEEINCIFRDEVDTRTKKEIELEENLKRKQFTWQEEVQAKLAIDQIKREKYGSTVKGHGGGWGLQKTADSLGESVGTISQDVRLAQALKEYPELSKERNKATAWKKYQRMREDGLKDALIEKIKVKIDVKDLVLGDAKKEVKKLESESADLLLTDPPFAISLDKMSNYTDVWGDIYGEVSDDVHSIMDVISLVFKECYRVLKNNRHAYVFFAIQHQHIVKEILENVGFHVFPTPLIWNKMTPGIGGNEFSYAAGYEAFFFCMKGRRPLNMVGKSCVFNVERVPPQRKIHPTEKPLRLLRSLIEQSTLGGEIVIDPFAGSASTLVASYEIGRKAWGCELNKDYYNGAVLRLEEMKEGEE